MSFSTEAENVHDLPPTTTFPSYWGHVEKYVHCDNVTFIHRNTVDRSWDDPYLMKSYCELAANATVVFTHSMGTSIFAKALQEGMCDLGETKWYSANGVIRGSLAADYVNNVCSNNFTAIKFAAEALGYCQDNKATKAYISLQTNETRWRGIAETAQRHLSGSLCGTTPFGIWSFYSAELELISHLVNYKEANDGLLSFSHCIVPNATYYPFPTANHYVANINHADGSCRNGDGRKRDQQACNWFSYFT